MCIYNLACTFPCFLPNVIEVDIINASLLVTCTRVRVFPDTRSRPKHCFLSKSNQLYSPISLL